MCSLVATFATRTSTMLLGSQTFTHFSSCKRLTHGLVKLIQKIRSCTTAPKGDTPKTDDLTQAKIVVVVQQVAFKNDLSNLAKGDIVSKHSPLQKLDPILDPDGVLRIGNCLTSAAMSWEEMHPIIIPKNSHIVGAVLPQASCTPGKAHH